MKDFLADRKQRVIINGSSSEWISITSGIPQGSVLGPILFLVFINDLPDAMSVCIRLLADDSKIFSRIKTQENRAAVQVDVTRVEFWADIWDMFYNKKKCHHLHVGNHTPVGNYTMMEDKKPIEIEKVEYEKDLGIIVDNKLNFREHITSKVNIANRNLGIMFKTFTYMDQEMFLNLYKSMVRPHLEYGSQIWSPVYKKDKIIIENVQRRGTRLVKSLQHLPYEKRLETLGLPTLEYRRERADMVQVYKIISGIDKLDTDALLTFSSQGRKRGHSLKLFKRRARLNLRKNSFSNRIVDVWNTLPEFVVKAPSLNAFKNRLNKHWRNHPFKFTAACYMTNDQITGQRTQYRNSSQEADIA